jgi:hypothetical protein
MAGYSHLTVDQRATFVLFAEIEGITTTRGGCGLFFERDGLQKETPYGLQPNIFSILFIGFGRISYVRFIAIQYEFKHSA